MADEHSTKICRRCGIEKVLTEFNKHKQCAFGRNSICRDCKKEARKRAFSVHPKSQLLLFGQLPANLVFRPIPEWSGYWASSDGRIWSEKRVPDCISGLKSLVPSGAPEGYLIVGLYNGELVRKVAVHKLILEAFVGPRPDGCVGRHLNDLRYDNRVENLAWGTPEENAEDKKRNGRTPHGEQHPAAKVTEEQARVIRREYLAATQGRSKAKNGAVMAIARKLKISRERVWIIGTKRGWKHIESET